MRQFLIQPQLVGDLTFARTTAASYYGDIVCNWERDGRTATFEISVPANTTATFHIPAESIDDIRESGQPVAQAAGVTIAGEAAATRILRLASGSYRFTSNTAPAAR
jgi:alpha-L-rhamnosidase